MRILKFVLLLFGIGAVVAWFMAAAYIGVQNQDEWYGHMDRPAVDTAIPACIDDSAPNAPCYWDAGVQGNGEGRSFTVDAFGNTHYWEDV